MNETVMPSVETEATLDLAALTAKELKELADRQFSGETIPGLIPTQESIKRARELISYSSKVWWDWTEDEARQKAEYPDVPYDRDDDHNYYLAEPRSHVLTEIRNDIQVLRQTGRCSTELHLYVSDFVSQITEGRPRRPTENDALVELIIAVAVQRVAEEHEVHCREPWCAGCTAAMIARIGTKEERVFQEACAATIRQAQFKVQRHYWARKFVERSSAKVARAKEALEAALGADEKTVKAAHRAVAKAEREVAQAVVALAEFGK